MGDASLQTSALVEAAEPCSDRVPRAAVPPGFLGRSAVPCHAGVTESPSLQCPVEMMLTIVAMGRLEVIWVLSESL
jgi:hypothetical protein